MTTEGTAITLWRRLTHGSRRRTRVKYLSMLSWCMRDVGYAPGSMNGIDGMRIRRLERMKMVEHVTRTTKLGGRASGYFITDLGRSVEAHGRAQEGV